MEERVSPDGTRWTPSKHPHKGQTTIRAFPELSAVLASPSISSSNIIDADILPGITTDITCPFSSRDVIDHMNLISMSFDTFNVPFLKKKFENFM